MSDGTVLVSFVVAVADNGVIGIDGKLPWHLSSDLRFFRKVTMGKPVIMGRKTFESIGKPLDGRDNIVVTRNADFEAPGVLIAGSAEQALALAQEKATERGVEEVAVIGGAEIYRQLLSKAHRIYLTEVHAEPEGDTHFPEMDNAEWKEISREFHPAGEKDSSDFSIVLLERV